VGVHDPREIADQHVAATVGVGGQLRRQRLVGQEEVRNDDETVPGEVLRRCDHVGRDVMVIECRVDRERHRVEGDVVGGLAGGVERPHGLLVHSSAASPRGTVRRRPPRGDEG